MNERIKNIVFDLGGVLVGLDGQRSIAAFDALGCERVSEYIREHRTEDLFYRIELGLISTHEFCEEVRQMTATSASDEEMVGAWNALICPVTARRRETLWSLRESGYRLFLLSNTNDMHWQLCSGMFNKLGVLSVASLCESVPAGRARSEELGVLSVASLCESVPAGRARSDELPFEQVFLSYEMHLSKPNVEIFREVLRQADLKAEETLFIDDNEDNIRSASSLGFRTYWNREIDDWREFVVRELVVRS